MSEIKQGYKQTEIGMIPKDWDCCTIEELIKDISMGPFGSNITVSNFISEGIPVLNGYNVSEKCLKDNFSNYVTPQKAQSLKKAIAKRGDVVVTHRGTIGQISFIPLNSKFDSYVISQSQFRVTFDKLKVLPDFVVLYFHSEKGQSTIHESKGHTGVPAIAQPTTTFRKFVIPLPILSEQTAIATALSDIDALITSLDKKITKKQYIKQGAMQQLLTGKKRLPGFSGEWVEKKLGDVCDFKRGQMITSSQFSVGSIPVIAGGKTPAGFHNISNRESNTITISGSGANAGFVAFHSFPIFASDCSTINEADNYNIKYIYYLLVSKQLEIYIAQTGGAQPHIHPKDIEPLVFNMPINKIEQTAIAQILTDMDYEITQLEAERNKYQQIKAGMMQQLLTGKIRLIKK